MPTFENSDCRYYVGANYDGIVSKEHLHQVRYSDVAYITWYIRSGGVKLSVVGETFSVEPGSWVFFDPFTVKSQHFQADTQLVSLRFRLEWHGLHFLPPLSKLRIYNGEHAGRMLEAAEEFCKFEAGYRRSGYPRRPSLECRRSALFADWLSYWHLIREEESDWAPATLDSRVYEIMALLSSHPGIDPIDYEELGHAVNLSRPQINRIFKDATGLTPRQWCDAYCLRAAEDYIIAGELSLKEIAAQLKFFDASHFTKWFKGKMGVTPKVWKQTKMG